MCLEKKQTNKEAKEVYYRHSATLKSKGLFRACLHGGGGPQVSEVSRLAGVTRLSI